MGDDVRAVEEEHGLDEVVDERGDEHGLQLDVGVLEDVGEGALRAVVRQDDDAVRLDAGADETAYSTYWLHRVTSCRLT